MTWTMVRFRTLDDDDGHFHDTLFFLPDDDVFPELRAALDKGAAEAHPLVGLALGVADERDRLPKKYPRAAVARAEAMGRSTTAANHVRVVYDPARVDPPLPGVELVGARGLGVRFVGDVALTHVYDYAVEVSPGDWPPTPG